jgi:hypothetical protein
MSRSARITFLVVGMIIGIILSSLVNFLSTEFSESLTSRYLTLFDENISG